MSLEINIIELLQEHSHEMTKKQKILADYIISDYQSVAFLNTKEIAKKANVSESTLLRLVDLLGFDRFSEFQDAVQALVREKMSTLDMYENDFNNRKMSTLEYIAEAEITILKNMLNDIDNNSFNLFVKLLSSSERICIVGMGADELYAKYLFRFLHILRDNVTAITHIGEPTDFHILNDDFAANQSQTFIAFHFPRYFRGTYQLCKLVADKGFRLIAVTDSLVAPLSSIAETVLTVPTRYVTDVDPIAAVMVLIHALLTGVIVQDKEKYKNRFGTFYEVTAALNATIKKNINLPLKIDNIES